jgi:RadC-like JAB domain-containing protein
LPNSQGRARAQLGFRTPKSRLTLCGWACRLTPAYPVVLAVKACTLALRALATCGRLRALTAAPRRGPPVSGNPARHRPELVMSHSSSPSNKAIAPSALLVCDADGTYRPASSDEVLHQAKRVLAHRVRRGAAMSSPEAVKDFLQLQLGMLEHEVFGVMFLDAQHRLIAFKEMFRGTVAETSVYPREVVKEALAFNAAAVIRCFVTVPRAPVRCPGHLRCTGSRRLASVRRVASSAAIGWSAQPPWRRSRGHGRSILPRH